VHHNYEDSGEDFDMMDIDHRARPFGALGGRIILLGDGSGIGGHSIEVDSDMFDHEDEDKDLDSQVTKGTPSGSEDESDPSDQEKRSLREGTPAPTSAPAETLPATRLNDAPASTQPEPAAPKESETKEEKVPEKSAEKTESKEKEETESKPTAETASPSV
jgi:protein phosphatase 2C family protein 2/3